MATARLNEKSPAQAAKPYVPRLSPDEIAERNRKLIELMDSWETEGDEAEQRETLATLREALGERRVASARPLFP